MKYIYICVENVFLFPSNLSNLMEPFHKFSPGKNTLEGTGHTSIYHKKVFSDVICCVSVYGPFYE